MTKKTFLELTKKRGVFCDNSGYLYLNKYRIYLANYEPSQYANKQYVYYKYNNNSYSDCWTIKERNKAIYFVLSKNYYADEKHLKISDFKGV